MERKTGMGRKKVILAVSFGTSFSESRERTIGAIEETLAGAFPEAEVRRAFTSRMIIKKLKERDGIHVDSVEEALSRAAADGVGTVVIQPTHVMAGIEYTEILRTAEKFAGRLERLAIGAPLLSAEADFRAAAGAVLADTDPYIDGETAVCLMGHGTGTDANRVYGKLQEVFREAGHAEYYVGTAEAEPSLAAVLAAVQAGTYRRVILQPFMIVAGDHANHDMAGDAADSWKSVFERAGYEVICRLRGLGELAPIRRILAEHARDAERLRTDGCAAGSDGRSKKR